MRSRFFLLCLAIALALSLALTSACVPTAVSPGGAGSGIGVSGGATGTAGGESAADGQSADETQPGGDSSGGVTKPSNPAPFRILTQARSNPVRKLLLDTVRTDPQMGSERGAVFVVRWLAVQSPWAMFQGETEGKRTPVEALLKRVGDEWTVVDMQKTNGRKITHARYPSVPSRVFGPASFSLAKRTDPDDLQILTNARGNSTRNAILDALRGRFTNDTVFVVSWLRVKSGWAYFQGDARTPGGELPCDAMFKRRSWGWEVLVVQGEGDFPESIPEMYAAEAPGSIFP